MAAIKLSSAFDSDQCCGGGSAPVVETNANLYYDSTLYANPTTAGLVPANPALPCVAFELNGNGGTYVWNPANATWNKN